MASEPAAAVPGGGAAGGWLPSEPAFSLSFCPHPPVPLPDGKGENHSFLMQGASPLASPRLNPGGTGFSFGKQCPKGGLSPGLPAGSAVPVPEGGLPALSPAYHAICLPFFPHPPVRARRALFPAGRGRPRLFHARGFAPCIPEAEPGRHGLFLWKAVPQGGLVPGVAGWLCCTGAQGGVSFASPAYHAICLPFSPIPPSPFPSGEGGDLRLFHARGFAPCIPGI